jgi:hypothetical protein
MSEIQGEDEQPSNLGIGGFTIQTELKDATTSSLRNKLLCLFKTIIYGWVRTEVIKQAKLAIPIVTQTYLDHATIIFH